jgi:hypothetical protein
MTDVYNEPDSDLEFNNTCNDADEANDVRKLDLFELLAQTFNPSNQFLNINQTWKQV